MDQLIEKNSRVALFFIHELARNLGSSDTKIVNLTQKHIRGRLAEALIVLIENYGYEEDSSTLRIYMSREDLANLSNQPPALPELRHIYHKPLLPRRNAEVLWPPLFLTLRCRAAGTVMRRIHPHCASI